MAETSRAEEGPEEISPEEAERRRLEQQWTTSRNLNRMLESLRIEHEMTASHNLKLEHAIFDRKFYLFYINSKNNVLDDIKKIAPDGDKERRNILKGEELYVEGKISRKELMGDDYKSTMASRGNSWARAIILTESNIYDFFRDDHIKMERIKEDQINLLHDIFGNPFSKEPAKVEPGWLTTNVKGLATKIYQEKEFDNMPILADALEDAGCTNQEMLNHCRGKHEHVRGCWVLDLILQKE